MPLPPFFKHLMLWLKIPALSFVIDNLGLSCFVETNFYTQLLITTIAPHALVAMLFARNYVKSCFDFAKTVRKSTFLALLLFYG